jgi:CBS domain containing-hemolysin-like protein
VTLGELSVAVPLAIACVVVAGFCSGTEVALFSLRRVDREQLSHSDLAADRRILRLLERPRRLIATVLIGNQALGGLLAAISLAVALEQGWVASPWASAGIALALALPLLVLIAEVTSKTLAAKVPLAWARACALPLKLFALLVSPVRELLQAVASVLLRPFGEAARARPVRDLSEEEFRTLVDAGSAQGQVDARERRLIHRVFEFNDKNVGQVMTPRERIFALSYDLPTLRLAKEIAARGFSRVPIYQKSLDNVRGILNAKALVRAAAGQAMGRPLNDLLHEPLFVPRTTPVKRLFLTFKQKKVHMAIVVSEYGKVLGLVTMDDLLSQIFGVLRDERADLQQSIPPGGRPRPSPTAGPRPGSDGESSPGSSPVIDLDPNAPADDAAGEAASEGVIDEMAAPADSEPEVDSEPDAAAGPERTARPGTSRPGTARLGTARPGTARPGTGAVEGAGEGAGEESGEGTGERPGESEASEAEAEEAQSRRERRSGILHPAPPPGLRPIHEVDEITPPAIDLAALRREHERENGS